MLHRHALALTCLVALTLAASCDSGGPTHDSVRKDSVAAMEEMVAVLKTVTDEPSANAAKPKLQALAGRIKTLNEQSEKLGKAPADKDAALKKEYEPRQQKAVVELLSEWRRIDTDSKLKDALKDVKLNGPN